MVGSGQLKALQSEPKRDRGRGTAASTCALLAGGSSSPRTFDPLVDAVGAERLATVRTLQDDEQPFRSCHVRPLWFEVVGERGEKTPRDRHYALVAPFAFGNEDQAFPRALRLCSAARGLRSEGGPPSNIASTIARSRQVRRAAIKALTSSGSISLGNVRGAWIRGTPRTPRSPSPGDKATRNRVGDDPVSPHTTK